MPIDASIPMSIKPPEIQNPLDLAVKGMTLRNLAAQSQEHEIDLAQKQRQFQDDMAMRDAALNNSSINPATGMPEINRAGYLQDVAKRSPLAAQSEALRYQQMDIDKLSKRAEIKNKLLMNIGSQQDLDYATEMGKQLGAGDLKQFLGEYYDPNEGSSFQRQLKHMQVNSMTLNDRLATQKAENEKMNLELQLQKLGLDRTKVVSEMADKMSGDLDPNRSRSGNYGQIAQKYQSIQRLQTLINAYQNGNQLSPTELRELGTGFAGVLAPGTPALAQIDHLVPKSMAGSETSEKLQYVFNRPFGANMGGFVDRLTHTLTRENALAKSQMDEIVSSKLPAHKPLQLLEPQLYEQIKSSAYNKKVVVPEDKKEAPQNTIPPAPKGKINVRLPDGRTGRIKETDWPKFQKEGAKKL